MRKEFGVKLAIVGVVACAAVYALTSSQPSGSTFLDNHLAVEDVEFMAYVAKYRKSYGTVEEYNYRLSQFKLNRAKIAASNMKDSLSSTGVNLFADWTPEEFKKILGYKKNHTQKVESVKLLNTDAVPASVDWRTKGAVTPVKNQGQCGSCWSFSVTGSMEGAHAIKTGKLVSLSEQQLVDCSKDNSGCNGGDMDLAFKYTSTNPLETEAAYPYLAQDESCSYKKAQGVVSATTFHDVAANDNKQLKAAVALGPVSIAIEADQTVFQYYNGGILNSADCGTQLDHGVLIVGYGS